MVTSEERREAAALIRNGAHDIDINGYIKLAINVVDRGDGATWGKLALKLADLIEPEPKRTGHAVEDLSIGGYVSWRCSECGQPINKADNYCSNCGVRLGAKAVE